jgi:uncharacterized damage-inducible protein DinB
MAAIDAIIMEIDQEAKTTQRVLDRIPEDKLAWKPHPKSTSLGQLAIHIAILQGRLAEIVQKDSFDFGAAGPSLPPQPASKKEIMDGLAKSTADAKELLKKLDDSQLMEPWTLKKEGKVLMSMPRVGFIRAILLNHTYHHRGQLSVYLRLLDVPVPSIYGPSADENPFG